MAEKTTKKEEPIYEKLEPGSCLIISKTDTDVLIACNRKGKVELQRVRIPEEAKAVCSFTNLKHQKVDALGDNSEVSVRTRVVEASEHEKT